LVKRNFTQEKMLQGVATWCNF